MKYLSLELCAYLVMFQGRKEKKKKKKVEQAATRYSIDILVGEGRRNIVFFFSFPSVPRSSYNDE